ncbi:MAG: dTDP-4-dehydrorhamnose 3,5-epimerase [Micropruina sp.]|uniref:dTDP-4-dehydrorhamnose 3,5-epimerase family protein n=1 Tax=Micropruina sp. TaxID=2737536 RepID=UPI0039E3C0D6
MVRIDEFTIETTAIAGLFVVRMKQIHDERGTVREFFRASTMRQAGLHAGPWQQLNLTETARGAVRGLHGEDMTKLVSVVQGSVFGAYVDVRIDSPTVGAVVTVPIEIGVQVLVPKGVCNGFQPTGDGVNQYLYCFDNEWRPGMPGCSVNPLDPALGIDWPIPVDPDDRAQLSAKDAAAPTLAETLAALRAPDAILGRPHASLGVGFSACPTTNCSPPSRRRWPGWWTPRSSVRSPSWAWWSR